MVRLQARLLVLGVVVAVGYSLSTNGSLGDGGSNNTEPTWAGGKQLNEETTTEALGLLNGASPLTLGPENTSEYSESYSEIEKYGNERLEENSPNEGPKSAAEHAEETEERGETILGIRNEWKRESQIHH